MDHKLERYVGRTVEIIYVGKSGRITQRHIEVREVKDGLVKAYCLLRCSNRAFRVENILAFSLVSRKRIG